MFVHGEFYERNAGCMQGVDAGMHVVYSLHAAYDRMQPARMHPSYEPGRMRRMRISVFYYFTCFTILTAFIDHVRLHMFLVKVEIKS